MSNKVQRGSCKLFSLSEFARLIGYPLFIPTGYAMLWAISCVLPILIIGSGVSLTGQRTNANGGCNFRRLSEYSFVKSKVRLFF
jgi:hypothetical protein